MSRGRPRKKAVEPEILPPEEDQQPKPKVIEVKHKTEWSELRPVEEVTEEDAEDFDDDDSSGDRPRRKTKNAREELRKKLRAQGVSPSTNLRLYIEKYLHSDSNTGGSYAETEFCTKYETTEEHILNKDYIDVARRWGAGKYRITVRMQNKIVDAFDQRISAQPAGPMVQHVNPNDPTSPQVIVQTPEGQQPYQPMSMKEIIKAQRESLKEELEMRRLLMESYGLKPSEQQQQQSQSEEEIIAGAIIKQPAVIESVVESIIKRVGGKGGDSEEPWYAGILKDSITTGQLAPTVQAIVKGLFPNGLFGGLGNMFSGSQNNGQAQMAPAPLQNQAQPVISDQQGQSVSGVQMQLAQDQSRQMESQTPAGGISGVVEGDVHQGGNAPMVTDANPQMAVSSRDHAMSEIFNYVIEQCVNKADVIDVADGIDDYIENEVHPFDRTAIAMQLKAIAKLPVETVIDYVKQLPNGEHVASLPHAKEWTAELQRLIKEAGQEGDEG